MAAWIFFITVFAYFSTHVEGSNKFGSCDIYTRDEYEQLNDVADCRSCASVFGEYYCKEWNCPETPCQNPVYDEQQCCPYCPDTCSYRGRVFDVGSTKSFRCIDGHNMCMCVASGKVEPVTDNPRFGMEFNNALNQCFWKRNEK